jgi:lipopolysaccharide transport system permease protein
MNTGKTNIKSLEELPSGSVLPGEKDAALEGVPDVLTTSEPHEDETSILAPDSHPLPVRNYTADSDLRHPLRLIHAMFHDLWSSRELAWRLFVRDLNAQYRQSILGYLWVILPPLISMFIWMFLYSIKMLSFDPPTVPLPVFIITGIVLWEAFVSALNAPQTAVTSAMGLLTKINFPREALLVSAAGQVVFGIIVRLLILFGVYAWYGVVPQATVWLAPLGLLALMMLGFSIGLILTPAVMLYQDFSRGLAIITGPWFLLTPVVYPSPTTYPGTLINWLNPVSPLLTGTRNLITEGSIAHPVAFFSVALFSVLLLFASWMFCRLAMPHLIARMSA